MKVVTHNGKFHGDDVTAIAILKMALGDFELQRTRDPEIIHKADIVVDVGHVYDPHNKRYDHHQRNFCLKRDNGFPYASAGLILRDFGQLIQGSIPQAIQYLDEKIIQYIDARDAGKTMCTSKVWDLVGSQQYSLASMISDFGNDGNINESFMSAVEFTQGILERRFEASISSLLTYSKAKDLMEQSPSAKYITFEEDFSPGWKDASRNFDDLVYCLYPKDGNWRAECSKDKGWQDKKKFPHEWRGKRDYELAKVSGVDDAVFCHKGGFLIIAKSYNGVEALVKKAL